MRFVVLSLLAVLLGVAPAAAKDQPKRKEELAADRVVAAVQANDEDALKALSEQSKPDPWLVADELCYRGEHDAADAFAKAAPRPDVEMLPAYVKAWRARKPDKAERERLDALYAVLKSKPQEVVDGTAATEAITVVQIQLLHVRAKALARLQKPESHEATLQKAAQAALKLGWLRRAVSLHRTAARSAHARSAWAPALVSWEACRALHDRRGEKARVARTLNAIGLIHWSRGDYDEALATFDKALPLWGDDKASEATTLNNIGLVHRSRGAYEKAEEIYQRVLAVMQALAEQDGDAGAYGKAGAATTLGNIGNVHLGRGDYEKAVAAYEDALEQMEKLKDEHGVARMLNNIGRAYQSQGKLNDARTKFEKALEKRETLKDKTGVATTRGNLGLFHLQLGEYAEALHQLQLALATMDSMQNKAGAAEMLGHIGNVHQWLGNEPVALEHLQRAFQMMKAMENKAGEAQTLGSIGNVHWSLGDYKEALAAYQQALAMMQQMQNKAGEASTLGNIGVVQDSLGQYDEALKTYNEALGKKRALGDEAGAAITRANIGETHQHKGEFKEAEKALKKAVRLADKLHARPEQVAALGMLARLYLETDKPFRALSAAQDALKEMEVLLEGLGDEHGATVREQHAVVFAVGALAATAEEETPDTFAFLESGRAGALLDMLGKGEAMRWKAESLSEAVQAAERRAQAAVQAAQKAYDAAVEQGDRKRTRAASAVLDKAKAELEAVAGRIQREVKRKAKLLSVRPETIENVQGALQADQAMVLYGVFQDDKGLDEALALVLRPDDDRVVSLGKASELEKACGRLTGGAGSAGTRGIDLDEEEETAKEDWNTVADRVRGLLIEPLELEEDVKQVLVSPDGLLCYLPFSALFEQTVVMTPSGTTHVKLLEEARKVRKPGTGILALGNPDYAGVTEGAQAVYYRGATPTPLPATRKEVETVGTTKLLGLEASEAGFRKALTTAPRWRAVHFACHGFVNTKRPMLSSLALSRTGEDDGFLTPLEIMFTEIPADLAVLSACDTSRGKIVKGEGIVGFTRALMFAGPPRVICSLWKVDDEATQALMVKFYELWNPKDASKGIGAATALKQAQEFIRGHDKWKRPHYWAAWVLWGLPD